MTPQPLYCLACLNEGDNVEPTVNFRPRESLLGLAGARGPARETGWNDFQQ